MAACLTCLSLIAPHYKATSPKRDTFSPNRNHRVVHFWRQWPGTEVLPGPRSQDWRRCGDPGQWRPSDSVSRCTKDNCWCWTSLCPKLKLQHWGRVLWLQLILQWFRVHVHGGVDTLTDAVILWFVCLCEDVGEQRCFIYLKSYENYAQNCG